MKPADTKGAGPGIYQYQPGFSDMFGMCTHKFLGTSVHSGTIHTINTVGIPTVLRATYS